MHVVETRHVRRFVLRLEPGEDVAASIEKIAKTEMFRAGWVRGRGVVAWADIATWDDAERAWRAARHLEGPFVLASLEGTITTRIGQPTVELDATLVRERDGSPVAFGGRLVSAGAISVELLLEVFEDVRLERQEDDAIGMAVWRGDKSPGVIARSRGARPEVAPLAPGLARPPGAEPRRPESAALEPAPSTDIEAGRPPPAASGLSWAAVATASAAKEKAAQESARPRAPGLRDPALPPSFLAAKHPAKAEEETSRTPARGDWVEHRQFGLCRVEGEAEDGGTRVRLPSGSRKTLRLDVLEILPPRHEADRTVFPVRPRSR